MRFDRLFSTFSKSCSHGAVLAMLTAGTGAWAEGWAQAPVSGDAAQAAPDQATAAVQSPGPLFSWLAGGTVTAADGTQKDLFVQVSAIACLENDPAMERWGVNERWLVGDQRGLHALVLRNGKATTFLLPKCPKDVTIIAVRPLDALASNPLHVVFVQKLPDQAQSSLVWSMELDGTLRLLAGIRPGEGKAGFALGTIQGVVMDPDGTLFLAEHDGHRILRCDLDGKVTPVAVLGESYLGPRFGPSSGMGYGVSGMTVDPATGDLLVSCNHAILRVSRAGAVEILLGDPLNSAFEPAARVVAPGQACLYSPTGLRLRGDDLFICDGFNFAIRVFNLKTGLLTTLVSPPASPEATRRGIMGYSVPGSAQANAMATMVPSDIAFQADGTCLVSTLPGILRLHWERALPEASLPVQQTPVEPAVPAAASPMSASAPPAASPLTAAQAALVTKVGKIILNEFNLRPIYGLLEALKTTHAGFLAVQAQSSEKVQILATRELEASSTLQEQQAYWQDQPQTWERAENLLADCLQQLNRIGALCLAKDHQALEAERATLTGLALSVSALRKGLKADLKQADKHLAAYAELGRKASLASPAVSTVAVAPRADSEPVLSTGAGSSFSMERPSEQRAPEAPSGSDLPCSASSTVLVSSEPLAAALPIAVAPPSPAHGSKTALRTACFDHPIIQKILLGNADVMTITSLDLQQVDFYSMAWTQDFGQALSQCSALEELSIDSCDFGGPVASALSVMCSAQNMHSLSIKNSALCPIDVLALQIGLTAMPTITKLDFSHNNITLDAIDQICYPLVSNEKSVEYISFSHNPIGALGLNHYFEHFLVNNKKLKSLEMASCGLGRHMVGKILLALSYHEELECLNLADNGPYKKSGYVLADILKNNGKLKELKVGGHCFSPEEFKVILEAAGNHPTLQTLDLSSEDPQAEDYQAQINALLASRQISRG